jgi:hypothetical protein
LARPLTGLFYSEQPRSTTVAYTNPADKRSKDRKVRFNAQMDRLLQRSATLAGKQHATFLHELIVWAVENGACETLRGDKHIAA